MSLKNKTKQSKKMTESCLSAGGVQGNHLVLFCLPDLCGGWWGGAWGWSETLWFLACSGSDHGGHTECQMPAHVCSVSRKDKELGEKCIQRCLSSKNLQAAPGPPVFKTVNQQCHLRNFLKY